MKISFYDAAQPYIRRGWPVFPVARNKVPMTKHGRHDASCDSDQLRKWTENLSNPNIAIATGRESGLVVIDIDNELGVQIFAELKERHRIPDAPLAKSARGYHLYFKNPGRCPSSQGRLGKHIDVRGEGGSITATPSIHESGHTYYWIYPLEEELPKLPLTLYPLLYEPRVVIHRQPIKCEDIKSLADSVANAVQGERNGELNRAAFIAGKMIAEGKTSYHEAYQALFEAARACGLRPTEIKPTIRSGLRSGQGLS